MKFRHHKSIFIILRVTHVLQTINQIDLFAYKLSVSHHINVAKIKRKFVQILSETDKCSIKRMIEFV